MQKKEKRKISYFFKYVISIFSWTFLVCLIICIGFLGYYFYSLKVYEQKGYKYAPPFSLYTIVSPSMVPTINVYDLVVNFKVDKPDDILLNDIITFKSQSNISKDLTITHRVNNVQIVNGQFQYVTKGDNNNTIDPAPATFPNVIGKTAFKISGFGKLQKFICSIYGWLLIIVLPALIILITNIVRLSRISRVKKISSKANRKLVVKTEK